MNRHQTYFLLLFFFGNAQFSISQNTCECPVADQLKQEIGNYFNSGKLDSARALISGIRSGGNRICEAIYFNSMSQVSLAENNLAEARKNLDAEYAILKTMNCPQRLGKHYSNYSTFYNFLNKQDSAVHVSLLGLEAASKANDTITQIRLYSNIGAFFVQMNQHGKALEYEEKGTRLADHHSDSYSKALMYSQIGKTYLILYETNGDEQYLKRAFDAGEIGLKSAMENRLLPLVLDSYYILSQYYIYKKEYALALNYADSILMNAPREGNIFNFNLQAAFSNKSMVYYELGKYPLAKLNADSAVYFGNLFNVQLTISPHDLIYRSAKKMGDFETALRSLERKTFLEDSLFDLEKNGRIAELEEKYNQAKNEKTIVELQQQDEIKGLRIRVLIFLIIVALFAIAIIALFFRQKTLHKNQQILETQQRLNRSRMNPHFFFNALTTLQGLAVRENDGKKIALNLSKFSSLMRKTLESSYNDYVTIDEEIEFMHQYVQLQKLKNPDRFEFVVHIQEGIGSDETIIPSMLIQPFLENAIEHGFSNIEYPGLLTLNFSQEKNNLTISITDNGSGFGQKEADRNHISRATQITKDRLNLLQREKRGSASLEIHELAEGGVAVNIVIPLTRI